MMIARMRLMYRLFCAQQPLVGLIQGPHSPGIEDPMDVVKFSRPIVSILGHDYPNMDFLWVIL